MMDTSAVHIWLVLWKAYDAVRAYAMADLSSLEMCMSDFAILEVLLHKGRLPLTEIASRVGLTPGSTTTAIDRLEERGLVARELSQLDRRSRTVSLTKPGRKLIRPAFEKHARALEALAQPLTGKERQALITLLKKFGFTAEEKLLKRLRKQQKS